MEIDSGNKLCLVSDSELEAGKVSAKRPLPQRMVYSEEARLKRLGALSEQQNCDLSFFSQMRLGETEVRGNIESIVGAIEIPVGVVGPLLVHGSDFDEEVFAPIATTEGALVSSLNRGCRALVMAGGVHTRVLKQRMVRAPLFDCGSLSECLKLQSWMQARWGEIQRRVREHSNHAVLLELDFRVLAPCLHVRFVYETGDASGQNMTTLCTWSVCQWLLKEYAKEHPQVIRQFVIDGNLSSDKKASFISAHAGRGREVVSEALLPAAVVRRVFGTSAREMTNYFAKSQATGILTGVHGLNVNVANVVAGIFAATGQDIACVHESSTAQVYFEDRDGDLYVSLLLPCLVIGTVGGGVSLTGQKQLLQMMGAYGPGKAARLAEIIAAFALALEISTGAALTSGHFADAHERLGRKRERFWFGKSDLNIEFFNHVLLEHCRLHGPVLEVEELTQQRTGESLVMRLASEISARPCGLWGYRVHFANPAASEKLFLKVKVPDEELLLAQEILAGLKAPGLGELLRENRDDSIFRDSHLRELKLAAMDDCELRSISPKIFGQLVNPARGTYILVQELLEDLVLFDAVERRDLWSRPYIEAAIRDISRVHGKHLTKTADFEKQSWMVVPTTEKVRRLEAPHYELAHQLHRDNMEWFSEADLKFHREGLTLLARRWPEIEQMPRTLVHNDFNPRNIAFRISQQNQPNLVAYDWELASVHLPQRDVAELLSFTLPTHITNQEFRSLIELHRREVENQSGLSLNRQDWLSGYELALMDLLFQRFPIYSIAQTLRQIPFLRPSYQMARQLLDFLRGEGL